MSYLASSPHVSKRGIEEIVEAVFGVPVSLGTVANLEQEMSAALAPAHQEALAAVQEAPVKHIDETGWKKAGHKRWLWVVATSSVVVFLIHRLRNAAVLLLFGYIFLLIFAIVAIAHLVGISWTWLALILALLHFAGALVCLVIVRWQSKHPIFRDTATVLKEDTEWLKNLDQTKRP